MEAQGNENQTNNISGASMEIDASRNSTVQESRVSVLPASNNLQPSNEPTTTTSPTTPSMLLSVIIFTIGATYTGLYNFSNIFPSLDNNKNPNNNHLRTFSSWEVFFSPRSLPEGFWFLTAATFTFVSSMIAMLVLICSEGGGKCAFWVRAVLLFVLNVMFISFMMMVGRVIPNFVVIIGGGHILSGFAMLCLCTLLVVLLSLAMVMLARLLWDFIVYHLNY